MNFQILETLITCWGTQMSNSFIQPLCWTENGGGCRESNNGGAQEEEDSGRPAKPLPTGPGERENGIRALQCGHWYLGNLKKSASSSMHRVFVSGASADGGADGPEVQWAGAVPAARQGVRGHVPPTGGGLRGWATGQTGRGGHAETAGQVGQLTPVCGGSHVRFHPSANVWTVWVNGVCMCVWGGGSCERLASCAGCIPASYKLASWISN